MNKFKYTLDNKRYHTFNYYLKNTYRDKVAKVILDAHFTCPNRDGSKGWGGCSFCSLKGSGDANKFREEDILTQYKQNKLVMLKKWPQITKFIPYFQNYTNTYGPIDKIQRMISPFLKMDEVVAIALGTRADALSDEVIDYLDQISYIKPIHLELGLQTSNDQTALKINRGHSFKEFTNTLKRLENTNIRISIHILNGLPNETKEDMLQTIKDLKGYRFEGIKIHMLHIIADTQMAKEYLKEPFKILSLEEYVDIVINQLELLDEKIVIERITGDPIKDDLIAPDWILNKTNVLNTIDKEMVKRDTYQGIKYEGNYI